MRTCCPSRPMKSTEFSLFSRLSRAVDAGCEDLTVSWPVALADADVCFRAAACAGCAAVAGLDSFATCSTDDCGGLPHAAREVASAPTSANKRAVRRTPAIRARFHADGIFEGGSRFTWNVSRARTHSLASAKIAEDKRRFDNVTRNPLARGNKAHGNRGRCAGDDVTSRFRGDEDGATQMWRDRGMPHECLRSRLWKTQAHLAHKSKQGS